MSANSIKLYKEIGEIKAQIEQIILNKDLKLAMTGKDVSSSNGCDQTGAKTSD
jgi:hypothetical protein